MPNKVPAARRLYRGTYKVTSLVVINAGVGILFSLLFFFVFIPQHFECYRRKSTAGLSPWLLLFGGTSFMFAFYNVLLMDIHTLGACLGDEMNDPETFNCIAVLSPILQQALPAITGYPSWYIWYHMYCPSVLRKQHLTSLSMFVTIASIGALISLWVLCVGNPDLTHFVGTVWGVIATVTNFIMWFPQIETTLRLKSRGAMSISTLIATIISDILFTLYLIVMANQHWSVWLPQVPDALQQMILIGLLWHFGDLSSDKPNPISTPMLRGPLSGPSSSTALLPITASQQLRLSKMTLNLNPNNSKNRDNHTYPNRNNGYASLLDGESSNGHTYERVSSMTNAMTHTMTHGMTHGMTNGRNAHTHSSSGSSTTRNRLAVDKPSDKPSASNGNNDEASASANGNNDGNFLPLARE